MAVVLNSIGTFTGTAVLFAVEREAKAFVRLFPSRIDLQHPFWAYCRDDKVLDEAGAQAAILVGVTGVGKTSARTCLEGLLAGGARPSRVVVAGFAGALREGLPLAEVLVAAEVVDESGRRWATAWPEKRFGRVLTCAKMIGEPARKKELGTRHDAHAVEMESAAVAEVCHRHGIPVGCVRVVSDDVNKPLSRRLMGLVESGRVRTGRVLWEVLRSPRMGVELVRLAKHTRQAADALARRLRELLVHDPSL